MGCCTSREGIVGRVFSSGNIYGMVVNHSRKTIQYEVYGGYQEKQETRFQAKPAPPVNQANVAGNFGGGAIGGVSVPNVNVNANIASNNENVSRNWESRHRYEPGKVSVAPGRWSTMYLNDLEPGKFKFSWKFEDEVEYRAKDGIIKTREDVCIKIREDRTFKQMEQKEVNNLRA